MLKGITAHAIFILKRNHIRIVDMSISARHTFHKFPREFKSLNCFLSACIQIFLIHNLPPKSHSYEYYNLLYSTQSKCIFAIRFTICHLHIKRP